MEKSKAGTFDAPDLRDLADWAQQYGGRYCRGTFDGYTSVCEPSARWRLPDAPQPENTCTAEEAM